MPKGFPKRGDDQLLEGGGAGMSSIKQFEKLSPTAERAQAKIDKANRMARERASNEALLEVTKNTPKTVSEMTDSQRAALTPGQLSRREQADKNFAELQARKTARKQPVEDTPPAETSEGMKKGGMTASRRADGIASRGKTRGRIY